MGSLPCYDRMASATIFSFPPRPVIQELRNNAYEKFSTTLFEGGWSTMRRAQLAVPTSLGVDLQSVPPPPAPPLPPISGFIVYLCCPTPLLFCQGVLNCPRQCLHVDPGLLSLVCRPVCATPSQPPQFEMLPFLGQYGLGGLHHLGS